MPKTVITYGTFDLFHLGHLRLLQRLRALGDRLIVGVSTDTFNLTKNKRALIPFEQRAEIVGSLRIVDLVIPEESWEQKLDDIRKNHVQVFGIGDDWAGKFDFLEPHCEVVYLPRTHGISSTALRELARAVDQDVIDKLRELHTSLEVILHGFD